MQKDWVEASLILWGNKVGGNPEWCRGWFSGINTLYTIRVMGQVIRAKSNGENIAHFDAVVEATERAVLALPPKLKAPVVVKYAERHSYPWQTLKIGRTTFYDRLAEAKDLLSTVLAKPDKK